MQEETYSIHDRGVLFQGNLLNPSKAPDFWKHVLQQLGLSEEAAIAEIANLVVERPSKRLEEDQTDERQEVTRVASYNKELQNLLLDGRHQIHGLEELPIEYHSSVEFDAQEYTLKATTQAQQHHQDAAFDLYTDCNPVAMCKMQGRDLFENPPQTSTIGHMVINMSGDPAERSQTMKVIMDTLTKALNPNEDASVNLYATFNLPKLRRHTAKTCRQLHHNDVQDLLSASQDRIITFATDHSTISSTTDLRAFIDAVLRKKGVKPLFINKEDALLELTQRAQKFARELTSVQIYGLSPHNETNSDKRKEFCNQLRHFLDFPVICSSFRTTSITCHKSKLNRLLQFSTEIASIARDLKLVPTGQIQLSQNSFYATRIEKKIQDVTNSLSRLIETGKEYIQFRKETSKAKAKVRQERTIMNYYAAASKSKATANAWKARLTTNPNPNSSPQQPKPTLPPSSATNDELLHFLTAEVNRINGLMQAITEAQQNLNSIFMRLATATPSISSTHSPPTGTNEPVETEEEPDSEQNVISQTTEGIPKVSTSTTSMQACKKQFVIQRRIMNTEEEEEEEEEEEKKQDSTPPDKHEQTPMDEERTEETPETQQDKEDEDFGKATEEITISTSQQSKDTLGEYDHRWDDQEVTLTDCHSDSGQTTSSKNKKRRKTTATKTNNSTNRTKTSNNARQKRRHEDEETIEEEGSKEEEQKATGSSANKSAISSDAHWDRSTPSC